MQHIKVTAIVALSVFEAVQVRLREIGVRALLVRKPKNPDQPDTFYARGWLSCHIRAEIFVEREWVDRVTEAIMQTAQGGTGDGVVMVEAIDGHCPLCVPVGQSGYLLPSKYVSSLSSRDNEESIDQDEKTRDRILIRRSFQYGSLENPDCPLA